MAANIVKSLVKIKIIGIPWTVNDIVLKQCFSQFGHINDAKVLFDKSTGLSRSIGFIYVADRNTADLICRQRTVPIEGFAAQVQGSVDG